MWKIEYDNSDEPYAQWWTVSDGNRTFTCDEEEDAVWLADQLNGLLQ